MPLILASGSAARAQMLRQAGLDFVVETAPVDEAEIKFSLKAEGVAVERVAEALAEAKAGRVAGRYAGQSGIAVIGADQMLEVEGEWLDKPHDLDAARGQLQLLRGKSHRLVSSVVLMLANERIWHHTASAYLRMRPFSDTFLDHYLAATAADVLKSVGCYQLEGRGLQLFDRIDGDFFTILGLPLLPLLGQLRQIGVIEE
ncbi:MAG TPA: nucleoside triphosphate pyrophosphatase [Terriglobia bacterium]|nr:nucleoside triphosphate pyrophosphatase [Terriglobia bacterium]